MNYRLYCIIIGGNKTINYLAEFPAVTRFLQCQQNVDTRSYISEMYCRF